MRDLSAFSDDVEKMMRKGHQEALRLGHNQLEVDHLLLGILAVPESGGTALLQKLGCDFSELKSAIERTIQPTERHALKTDRMPITREAERVLIRMHEEADESGREHIGTEHILLSMLHEQGHVAEVLVKTCGITYEQVRAAL